MDIFYPAQLFANWISYGILQLSQKSILGGAINFFIYDTIKIFILLLVIIFIVTFLRSYLSPEKVRKLLVRRFEIVGNVLAALIGIVTLFCSCSAIPLFIGFLESGVPLGVTFSYLISAPMVNEVAAVMLLSLFGFKIALLYIVSGVTIAIVVGFILGRMKLDYLVEDYVWKIKVGKNNIENNISFKGRLSQSYSYTVDLFKKIFPYVIIGVGIGAFIHGYAPENLLTKIAGKGNPFAVPIAVAIGAPLYANVAGVIPIVSSLIEKGLPIGTSLAFMMATVALSFPEMVILHKVLKTKLLAIYVTAVVLGIIFTGYLFNIVL